MAIEKDYDVFAVKYFIDSKWGDQGSKIDKMKNWCDEAEITGTPTIFINGKRLPDNYRIDELKNILKYVCKQKGETENLYNRVGKI